MTKRQQPNSTAGKESFLERLDDEEVEAYIEGMIQMGKEGAFSGSGGAVTGGEYEDLDKANGVKSQEVVPEVTDIQW